MKGVQCYELFGGIALKIHTFSFFFSFCVTCSAVSCLSEIIGAYIVPAYSSMGLVTVLYVFVKVSLFLPQWVEVRAFSILIVF